MDASDAPRSFSVVIPVHDEEANIEALHAELQDIVGSTHYEILYVDDGSRDGSADILSRIAAEDPQTRLLRHAERKGQEAATLTGIEAAKHDIIVTMDADLQHDPRAILPMIQLLDQGADVVCAIRRGRGKQDPLLGVYIPSRFANLLLQAALGVPISESTSSMRALKKEWASSMLWEPGAQPFLPAMAAIQGARLEEVEMTARSRLSGKSKYGFSRYLDGLSWFLRILRMKKKVHREAVSH